MNIKQLNKDDAEVFLQLLLALDDETTFMLYEQGERNTTVEEMSNRMEAINKTGSIFAFEVDNILVGFILIQRSMLNKINHCASIAIGVLQKFSSKGIATQLMQKAEQWCIVNNISRLELTVMKHNTRAIKLYQRIGFEIEGTRKRAILMNDIFYDEYYMGKILK
ncbi:MAG: GNAT family N-acetyltransferase [Chitinophagales bacterium]|nr:GNAT family N-acetyltransferase [Chitinophagales bacterium]